MADKVAKPKKSKSKAKKDDKGVLAALPSTRPERIGTRRTGATESPATRTETAAAKTAPKAPASEAKPARKKPAAARRKAAAPRTFEPTEAAEAAAGKADERAAGVAAEAPPAAEPRPRPVREGAPGMGTTSPEREQQPSSESGRPTGAELVSTAVQAAGELTQIGLAIGGRIIKRAVDRLPKP